MQKYAKRRRAIVKITQSMEVPAVLAMPPAAPGIAPGTVLTMPPAAPGIAPGIVPGIAPGLAAPGVTPTLAIGQPTALRAKRVFESVRDVEEEMASSRAHAQAFYALAKGENRGLTEQEVTVVQQHLNYCTMLKNEEIPRMMQFEQIQRDGAHAELEFHDHQRSTLRGGGDAMPISNGGQFAIHRAARPLKQLKGFNDALYGGDRREAHQAAENAGRWLSAMVIGDRESIEYCNRRQELRACYEQSMDAQTVDDDSKGGYLVPDIVSTTILDVRDRNGVIPLLARNYTMVGEKDLVNKRATGLTVYKPGEDAAITTSEKTWSQVTLSANDAYTLTYISSKLMRGAVVSAVEQVVNEIGYAFAKQIDYEGINGTGSAPAPDFGITGVVPGMQPGSILPSMPADWAGITNEDVAGLIGLLPDRFHDNAVFVCSRAFWALVLEPMLEARAGSKGDIAASSTRALKGYPIHFTEEMPTSSAVDSTSLLFGSFFESMLFGEREGVGVQESTHHRFNYDQLAIRGKIAYDTQFHERGTSVLAGGIVGLKTAAAA